MEEGPIRIKTVFMGTSDFAAGILERLIGEKYNLIGVFTQPGKKAGRNKEVRPSAVRSVAEKAGLPIFEPEKLDTKTISMIREQAPDIIIVAAYGKIIPKEILDIPGFGAINVHPSLLPELRGPSPIQNALLLGKEETGTTIMLMDEGIDSGAILSQEKLSIGEKEGYGDLSKRLLSLSADLLAKTLPEWIARKIEPQPQDQEKATYCQLIEREDGRIIWSNEAREISDRARAFEHWPGIFCYWENSKGNQRIKLNSVDFQEEDSEEKRSLGEVFEKDGALAVQTGKGILLVEEIQLEGKKSVPISDFLNGYPEIIGSILK